PGADVETKAPTLTTLDCNADRTIGTLVVTPSGANDEDVGIRVVAGVTTKPEDCAANGYVGCVVARRTVRFTPHSSIDVDVALDGQCEGISCDAFHSCALGSCIEATVGNVTTPDAGIVGPTVRCGDNGARCATTGDVCCLTVDVDAGTSTGECKPSTSCPSTSIVLNCDKASDCDFMRGDSGQGGTCILSNPTKAGDTAWEPNTIALSPSVPFDIVFPPDGGYYGYSLGLCDDRQACVGGTFTCIASQSDPPNLLPGYFWCQQQ
ncbi:MAG: hypothetical protein ACHREM_22940, partial [Polyangiales bacterium]